MLSRNGILVLREAARPWVVSLAGIATVLILAGLLLKVQQVLQHRRLVTRGALAIGRVRAVELERAGRADSFYLIDYEFKDSNGRSVQGQARVNTSLYSGEKTLAVFFDPRHPRRHLLALAAFYEPADPAPPTKTGA